MKKENRPLIEDVFIFSMLCVLIAVICFALYLEMAPK